MKYLGFVVVAGLAALAVLLPDPAALSPEPNVPEEVASVAVCAIEEGSGRTTAISVLSTVDGPVSLTLFAGGETTGSIGHETGSSGSITIPVVDVAAVGTVGGLVEMPVASSAAGALVSGAESMSSESCSSVAHPLTFLTGATTASGDTFQLHLMNPYAGEAVVELTVNSEAGNESNARFEAVIVPPRSSHIVDFTELVPGRETLSIVIETSRGRVISVGRQGAAGESAIWQAVPPAQDWFIPIPGGQGRREVVVATPINADVEYQVDFYGPEGLEEGLLSGVMPARGRATIDVTELSDKPVALRIISTAPIVPTLWIESEEGLSVTTASPRGANRWLLPGAGVPAGGRATVVILNISIDDSTVTIRPLRRGTTVRTLTVGSDSLLELALEAADGYLIESVGETVVLWSGHRSQASVAAIGVPMSDE
jgi:hypothetical protein